jgi:hypothetical protein
VEARHEVRPAVADERTDGFDRFAAIALSPVRPSAPLNTRGRFSAIAFSMSNGWWLSRIFQLYRNHPHHVVLVIDRKPSGGSTSSRPYMPLPTCMPTGAVAQ